MHRIVIALALAGSGLLLGVALVAADGGPHGNYTFVSGGCASCHRAHTGQADNLLFADVGQLCFSCHDGTGAGNDVWDGARLSPEIATRATDGFPAGISGALRGGGIVYARIDSDGLSHRNTTTSPTVWDILPGNALANNQSNNPGPVPPSPTPTPTPSSLKVNSAHVKFGSSAGVDGNALTPQNVIWGNGAISSTKNTGKSLSSAEALVCVDCHNPHGGEGGLDANGNVLGTYRILRKIPYKSDASTGVILNDETTKTYTTTNYWTQYAIGGAGASEPWTPNDMSRWCSTCHTRYLTGSEDNSGDALFKYRHKSNGNSSMTGQFGAPYKAETFSTQCLQCHVSHGSNASMNPARATGEMPWPGSTTARGNESTLLKINERGTCVACHGTTPGDSND